MSSSLSARKPRYCRRVPPELAAVTELASNPIQSIGIPIALIGAVFLSFGAQFQHRGVNKVEAASQQATGGLDVKQLLALLGRPSWVLGSLMLALAIVFQLTSLNFAPIIVVQPLGAIALVITSILNARVTRSKLNRASVISIVMCVGGVALFVLIAAFTAVDKPIQDPQLVTIVIILAVVLALFVTLFVLFRKRMRAVSYIVGAGVLYGFVATLAKVVISRLQQGDFEWLTFICLVGLLASAAAGAYFVQTAYASGPPDLVIAGLTVIDPMVAVGIGIVVLGEAQLAPPLALVGFVLTGILAVLGVFGLARYHPQTGH
ncbi:multidrug DMT transporter permease [Subtercola boreus]|uniref:Multidrug DMT transporter permease n=1 Tax=Subtercola boreus TaxID=120213 RepID=A0A3E0WAR4_9MICO|nr:multidrug DMT transporter permease [Subtercola boreus]RFA20917.1 multidrug DMT transporter permease [Subtercola boreus]RFA27110.1 multidrug DMT transporter permease [Subtercola boreus]